MKLVYLPVKQTEKQINPTEDQQILIQQPVDAPSPSEQQLGEAAEPHVGHFKCVRHCHGSSVQERSCKILQMNTCN